MHWDYILVVPHFIEKSRPPRLKVNATRCHHLTLFARCCQMGRINIAVSHSLPLPLLSPFHVFSPSKSSSSLVSFFHIQKTNYAYRVEGGVKDQWAEVLNTCAVMTLRSAYLYMHVLGWSHWQSPCKFLIEIAT